MSLFENFFKVLSLYFEAINRIRIKVDGRIRIWIRIHIKVTSRIRIRIKLMRFCKTRQITVKAKYIELMCDLKLLYCA